MIWLLRLDEAHLGVPFLDRGDVLLNGVLAKSLIDNGWVWRNPFLGAPFGTQLLDFPFYDNLDLGLMKLIALFTSNYAVILNLFFLATFPLAMTSSLVVLRSFKITYPSAVVVSVLFAFIPYHFQRGEAHLFLSAYFLIPLMTMVVLWIWTGGSLERSQEERTFLLDRRHIVYAVVVCTLVGSAVSYYTFFGCYFIFVATLISAIRFKSPVRLAWGGGFLLMTVVILVVNTSPNWLYALRHGSNPQVAQRSPVEAEVYGLKLTHLLLPVNDHRIQFLRNMRQRYNQSTTDGEGQTASLGFVGDVGFLFLLGWVACSPEKRSSTEWFGALGVLALAAVLLGTVGGLGSLFNFLIYPQIRAYNRISIYIAFFSLFGMAVLLDHLRQSLGGGRRATYLWYAILGLILILGILDQTNRSFAPDHKGLRNRFRRNQEFIAEIEASVPTGTMIFELPNAKFPEAKPIGAMGPYDDLRGYLHSRSLRWSGGAMRGRPEALWPERNGLDVGTVKAAADPQGQNKIALQLSPQALDALALAGFGGIYIDRKGFWDLGASITSQLQATLGEVPLESENHRWVFFNLTSFAEALHTKYSPEQWYTERNKILEVPSSERARDDSK
jgi:phosphoglycerol transferase